MLISYVDQCFVYFYLYTTFSVTLKRICSANLNVPKPVEQIPYKPASEEQLAKAAKKKKGPQKAPMPTKATTAR